jgi:hypothetical protein
MKQKGKTQRKISKAKILLLEKINKISKPLHRLTKKKSRKTQMTKVKHERESPL